jgi:hypothetical protein
MSPITLLLLLVQKGFARYLIYESFHGDIKSIKIGRNLILTHMLIVDYVLLFGNCSHSDALTFHRVLQMYGKATCMVINNLKSSISAFP